MAAYRICVSDERHDSYDIERELLASPGAELVLCQCATDEDIVRFCADADGILLDMAPLTAHAVAGLKRCKVVSRYGVGYDNVDVAACTARGIQVTNVPDYCAEDVAEHALALMLSCLRDVARRDRLIRQGKWNLQRFSFRLEGKVLGVIGFGRIARALVRKCSGLGFSRILAYDPYVSSETCTASGVVKADLEEVLKQSDLISLHMPVTAETAGIIGQQALSLMKPTSILVNTGRGPLVDDAALIEALRGRKILCAGLDTHNQEPLPDDSPYFRLDNVILTDHTAYSTAEAVQDLKAKAAQNIVSVLTGAAPAYPVNQL